MSTSTAALLAAGALAAGFAWWRFAFFHRNPVRRIPPGNAPLSAADGRILHVEDVALGGAGGASYHRRVAEAFGVTGTWTVVATYLSLFDVHVVRSPVAGTVRLRPIPPLGGNASMGSSFFFAALRRPLPLSLRGYADKNEILGVAVDGERPLLVVLMADWWIDQIVADVADGDRVTRGQVLGRIRMGSQVDVWTPTGTLRPDVQVGERVRAGLTVLGQPLPGALDA